MGTPDFAVPSLQTLIASQHTVMAVVTAPDKPRGRGRQLSGTPVKAVAESHRIPVLQPESLRDDGFIQMLASFQADVFVVVAFKILPPSVFTLPSHGTFNLHASLLPRYRGAAPINWALINGDSETGVTTFIIREKVDTGNILLQEKAAITPDMTAGELHDILAMKGAGLVSRTVDLIASGKAVPDRQDDSLATPAPKIFRENCRIDWNRGASDVHNFIRGLSPHPAAWTMHGEKVIKLYRTQVCEQSHPGPAGSLIVDIRGLQVLCGSGALRILALQQEGRKTLPVMDFLRGYGLRTGDYFGLRISTDP